MFRCIGSVHGAIPRVGQPGCFFGDFGDFGDLSAETVEVICVVLPVLCTRSASCSGRLARAMLLEKHLKENPSATERHACSFPPACINVVSFIKPVAAFDARFEKPIY